MDIETRVTNLENMLASIMKNMSNQKFYTDADIAGCRHTEGELGNANNVMSQGIAKIDERTAPFTTRVQKQMIPGKVMSMLVTKLKAGTYSILGDVDSLDVASTNDLLTKSNDTFTLLKVSYVSITATSETKKVCSLLLNKI